jgi:hypothetical protein
LEWNWSPGLVLIIVEDVARDLLRRVDLREEEGTASLLLFIFLQRNVIWVGLILVLGWAVHWASVGLRQG